MRKEYLRGKGVSEINILSDNLTMLCQCSQDFSSYVYQKGLFKLVGSFNFFVLTLLNNHINLIVHNNATSL